MNNYSFIFINFMVSLFSDILLNDLSTNFRIIKELKPYFLNKSIIVAGIYAGITIISALIPIMMISKYIYNFYTPNNINELIKFNILAFVFGYIYDIIIEKANIFSGLDKYYKKYGSGFWGAFAFLISINISYLIQKYIIPKLQ
jgi:hypothetical protein